MLAAYEIIADSYLSVSTPVQVAAPALLAVRVRSASSCRLVSIATSARWTRRAGVGRPSTLLGVEGGMVGGDPVPAVRPEEDLVVTLVTDDGVLVHPGFFFDFAREAFLVRQPDRRAWTVRRRRRRLLARACGSSQ